MQEAPGAPGAPHRLLHRPFVQVAGHGEILLEADLVVKPSSAHEALFYERAREHAPQLVPYMPEYRGRRDGRSGAKRTHTAWLASR
jgi:hypothetical protein